MFWNRYNMLKLESYSSSIWIMIHISIQGNSHLPALYVTNNEENVKEMLMLESDKFYKKS